ncbi:MAG: prephenate dehydrogenase/arogenate dehydrogenase family protein [Dehalococcoidia bacterium]|nr:prephenate dehydrogenase/arogenate dehydrogenase family protein [Dehalococcoidia bacterium]
MKIAIIGASGKMGSWFAAFLHTQGHDLILIGRRPEAVEEVAAAMPGAMVGGYSDVREADLVLISVPLDAVESVMSALGPHIRPNQAVIDVSSVKTAPQRAADTHMPHACFLGVHPMFGPGADGFRGHNVILTPVGEAASALAAKAKAYLEPFGAHIVCMNPQTHDEVMAVVLGLPALVVALVARTALATGHFALAREVSGTSLEVLVSLTESMLCEGSELYGTLLAGLPDAPDVAQRLEESASHFRSLVEQGGRTAMIDEFAALGGELEKLDYRAADAYARMYAMLEALKRFPSNPNASEAAGAPPPRAEC